MAVDAQAMSDWERTREWLIADLCEHRCQSSWDWTADKRWAEHKGDFAYWQGAGEMSRSTFGVGRFRVYTLA